VGWLTDFSQAARKAAARATIVSTAEIKLLAEESNKMTTGGNRTHNLYFLFF